MGGMSNQSGANLQVFGSASHPATLAFSGGGTGFTGNAGTFGLFDTAPLTLFTALTNSATLVSDWYAAVTFSGDFANSGALNLDVGSGDGGGGLTIGGT